MKPALLVIDVQQAFLPYMSKADQDMAIEMMNWAIQAFRKFNLPVIRVYHQSDEWGVKPGAPEFDFPSTLQVTGHRRKNYQDLCERLHKNRSG